MKDLKTIPYKSYYGTYLGQVKGFPEGNLNQVSVIIPEVDPKGVKEFIAMPKGMVAGKDYGFNYVPKKGDYVYISFRHGMLKYPLWEPGYWAINERPKEFNPDIIGYKFRDGATLIYDEANSEFSLLQPSGATISLRNGKFSIKNNEASAKDILEDFIQEIIQAVILTPVGPGSMSPTTIAKLVTILNRLNLLFE